MTAVRSEAVAALLRAHPGRYDSASAQAWVADRRAVLLGRCSANEDVGRAVSSGCAATGAATHARELADDARHALGRLEAGAFTTCELCGELLDLDRLEAAPAAVRCVRCTPRTDTSRWCR
ncbi:hypothetical protein BH24ACT10_BH24ACT10_16350 [soil metagenome]